jgi:VanZ family protein
LNAILVRSRSRVLPLLPAIGWMALIFALSAREAYTNPLPLSAHLIAIGAHLFLYGALGLLLFFGFLRLGIPGRIAVWLAITVAAMYGVSDELHQAFVPGRSATPFDIIVDVIGATAAVLLASSWLDRRRRRR